MKRGPVKKAVTPIDTKYVPTTEYIESVRSHSYLGKKGYTVPKSVLSPPDLEFLQKDLMLKPEIQGVTYGAPKDEGAFPVYRENDKKMYLPRFYGIERYGLPDLSEIEPGMDIDVPFVKDLRDYQIDIVDKYMAHVSSSVDFTDRRSVTSTDDRGLYVTFGDVKPTQPISKTSSQHASGGILQVFTGSGKTVMAIKIISLLKKKTMILVHKEFLMNQWIERIQEYAPQARVGKIQAQIYDVDNKDIVIAMIQTMYNKPFPQDTYSQFGLTIIDEVHRIGSEEFSKTLLKTITPYMLGISATVVRKDKLTRLLHMFIGPMVYSTEKKQDDPVCVRGIVFKSTDHEFNETETDFRGKPKYSTMISKLCNFGPRKDFLVRILQDLREENPDAQIMILAHNRSLLTYLYEAIQHRGFATVGFYVGGMKQSQLKATEEQNIVLATYAMAAEALDIKTLSILVLATPKTDIVQSVGRILRMKHEKPIVVDVVDSHDLFQNQWRQRKTYYRKCNYRIRSIDSTHYRGFMMDLATDISWLRVFEPKLLSAGKKVNSLQDFACDKSVGFTSPLVTYKPRSSVDVTDLRSVKSTDDEDDDDKQDVKPTTIFGGKCMLSLEEFST